MDARMPLLAAARLPVEVTEGAAGASSSNCTQKALRNARDPIYGCQLNQLHRHIKIERHKALYRQLRSILWKHLVQRDRCCTALPRNSLRGIDATAPSTAVHLQQALEARYAKGSATCPDKLNYTTGLRLCSSSKCTTLHSTVQASSQEYPSR